MAFAQAYERQVALLMRVMPLVMEAPDFALKGGTAINLFIRNLPRLSVDIDLTYLPIQDRAASLAGIEAAMQGIAARIEARTSGTPAKFIGPLDSGHDCADVLIFGPRPGGATPY